ncbi:MAG: hypothetical protein LBN93_12070 [Candidatus Symbiothrix sp.]|jgi:hypothetical protein|nr:hypothetical protein [Candidatus Symbiothrix sp.]
MKADSTHITALIDKYFEGLTTLQEEQTLRDYFQTEPVAEALKMYQPMFQYFAAERPQPKPHPSKERSRILRTILPSLEGRGWGWGLGLAAASLLLLFSLPFALNVYKNASEISLAYIDGQKQTDIVVIQQEALTALESLSAGNDAVYSSQIDALDDVIAGLTRNHRN